VPHATASATVAERRSVTKWLLRLAAFVVAVVVVYVGVTAVQVVLASRTDQRAPADAIVVLGAAQYDGRPSPALQRRLDHALALYQQGVAPEIVLTGSKQPDDRFTEAFAGYKYLIEAGVPESDLRLVDDGKSTWESMAAAQRVLREEDASSVILVSDRFHNRRLQSISSELGLDAQVSSTGSDPSVRQIANETARVAVGQLLGYRRLFNATG
jgi:vancomycin permeability regulator SanA